MLTFRFSGADGVMVESETLTSGMTGKRVKLEFSSDWENLKKTAVFTAGPTMKDVLNIGDEVIIPHEVLRNYGDRLYVGIFGVAGDETVTPTIYARGPRIARGADPSGDPSTDPSLPVWAQLEARIDELPRQNPTVGTYWTAEQINQLDQLFDYIPWTSDEAGAIADSLIASLRGGDTGGGEEEPVVPEVTLTSISAVYSGGSVPVGTAVTALTGVVVTAHYSDGTSETVTGYTLSGEIAEGENTVTVTYQGRTAAFTVTGVAESGGGAGETKTLTMTKETTSLYGTTFYEGDADSTVLEMSGGTWYKSDAIADEDTVVNIAFTGISNNANLNYYAAQIKRENSGKLYYVEKLGSSTTTETVKNYTVRSGYELVIFVSSEIDIAYLNVTHMDGTFSDPSVFYTNMITSFEANAYLNGGNGTVTSGWNGQSTTDYIDVTGLDSVYSIRAESGKYLNEYRSAAFYDADKQFVSGISTAGTGAIEIPDGAVYIRVDVANGNPRWYVGTDPEPYCGEFKEVA